ncbi:lysophospholipid acyltransferase family protein [Tunicatimonas pelagia]|nr:lysophospholipid acyltransferase family protein [Tunicatimonas pelagia]WKN46374.1 lysophospholipid acyltransferase family protein [Tunicatimonas pelagia]
MHPDYPLFLWPMFILRFLSHWPLSWLYALADFAAFVSSYIVRYRRKTIEENLRKSFPEKSSQEIRQIRQDFYHNLADISVETLYGRTISVKEMKRRVEFDGMEIIEKYYQQRQSIIILATHQCNWEWLLLAGCLRLPYPVDAMYKKLANSNMDDFMYSIRSRFEGKPINKDHAARAILKRKHETRAIAVVADQTPSIHTPKDWITFLHQKTGFYQGVEQLPRLTKYPVVFAAMYRISRGCYRVQFQEISEPPYDEKTQILSHYVALAETVIRQQPANWLWSHRRWKYTDPSTPNVSGR